ncbi:MFS transporter [Paludibaculum fermentans]|uniref:MFS transporter n=1 Tax=Paludibaculum fermentans TaxID=1473598 RepID=UPI003EBF23BC
MLLIADILGILTYGMIAAMLGTILPELSKKFGLSPKQNGNIGMAQAVGLMIGSFCAGPLMDLEGKKLGMLLALTVITVALIGLRSASGYGSVAGLMLLLGTGGGALVTAAFALAGDISVPWLQGAAVFNAVNLFFGLGGLITPLVAARLFQNNANRLLIFAASIAVIALAVNGMTAMSPPSGKVAFQADQVSILISSPVLLLLSLALFLYVACEVGVWNWLARHLIAQGVPESKALTILSLGFALGLLLGRIAVVPVLASVTPKMVLFGAGIAMAITTYLMLQTGNPKTAWIFVFLGGLAMAPVFPTALGLVGGAFKAQGLDSTATGLASTAGWLGLVISSPVIGGMAGDDPRKLKKALLLLPIASAVMAVVILAL